MKKTVVVLMAISMFSMILGFLRDIILSYFYGASYVSDAYLISLTIPNVILAFIGAGILTNYIPMYTQIEKRHGLDEGNTFTNGLVNILVLFYTIISLVSLIFTEYIVKIFASGFDKTTLELAILFTRIGIISIYFTGLIHVFKGFLQIKGNYVIPALIGIPMNIVIMLSIFISYKINVSILAVGSVIAALFQFILVLYASIKKGYKYKLTINISDDNIKKFIILCLPVTFGTSIDQINTLVDRTIASQITIGGISALSYANTLIYAVQGVFVVSAVSIMYPSISKMATSNNIEGFKRAVFNTVNGINLLVVPATVIMLFFSKPIVALLLGRGAFDDSAISLTSNALFYYSIGLIGIGLRDVISKAFYSLQDTKTPMVNASIALIINIILNVILSRYLGVGGLALATSISIIFSTILLLRSLRKKIGSFGIKIIFLTLLKLILSAIVMGIISKLLFEILILKIGLLLSLVISITIGGISYLISVYLLKVEGTKYIVKFLKDIKKSRI